MAAVELTFSGVLYDKYNRSVQNVVLIGEASLTGVGVGNGPIFPPDGPGAPTPPDRPRPTPPVAGWPSVPGFTPGGPGGPGIPSQPPGEPPAITEPPVKWKAVWTPTEGWVAVGIITPEGSPHPTPSGAAAPKK